MHLHHPLHSLLPHAAVAAAAVDSGTGTGGADGVAESTSTSTSTSSLHRRRCNLYAAGERRIDCWMMMLLIYIRT